jgi:hypothetical protein
VVTKAGIGIGLETNVFSEGIIINKRPKRVIFQQYRCKNKLHFDEMMMMSALYYTNMLSWIFIVLAD